MMYPKKIMKDVFWAFYGKEYTDKEEFIKAVNEYHKKIGVKLWNPDFIEIECKELSIQYSYWDEEDEEVEENFNLTSETFFTSSDLLFAIHNKVVDNLKNEDNKFFEGLILWEGENYDNPNTPLYFMLQGS